MPPIRRTMTLLDWTLLMGLSLLWGGSFLFNALALQGFPPLTLVFLRVSVAAVALHLVLQVLGQAMPRDRAVWSAFLVMGVLNNAVPFSLIVIGQMSVAVGLASILNATTPLFTALVAHLWTDDEKLSVGRVIGLLSGLVGVAVIVGPEALHGLGGSLAGQIACLSAALSYAVAGVYGRRFRTMGVAPLAAATGQVTGATLVLLPLALLIDRPWNLPVPGLGSWGAVLALALACTALAYLIYFALLARAGATNLLLVTVLVPPVAVLLGALVLGELLASPQFVGLALIVLGLGIGDGRPVGWLRRALAKPLGRGG